MNTVVIGLGSNIDAELNIEAAKKLLASKFKILRLSSFYKTAPQGNVDLPEFINGAVLVETSLPYGEVKEILKVAEILLGRTEEMHNNKSRIIDFDIHVWNHEVVDPYFYQWEFIRKIVLELIPELPFDQSKVVML